MAFRRLRSLVFPLALLAVAAGGWVLRQRGTVRTVPILMYHKTESGRDNVWWVSAEDLDAQLAHLHREGYRSILPDDLAANRRWGKPLPDKPVILTFDDGYLSAMTVAEPLLRKHGFRGIVYLATTFIGPTPAERRSYGGVPMLTWDEVRAMRKRGTFAFGAHTRNHVDLRLEERPLVEIRASRTDIRKALGREPRSLAYPFGIATDRIVDDARRTRFTTGMVCEDRLATVDGRTDLLRLPRVSVYGGAHGFDLAASGRRWQIRKTHGIPIPAAIALRAPGSERRTWLAVTARDERLNDEPFAFEIPPEAIGSDGRAVVEVWGRSRVIPYFATTVDAAPSLGATP